MAVLKCVIKAANETQPVKDTDRDGLKGQCPECSTMAPLTKKGFIGAHTVRNEPTPASPALTETTPPVINKGATKADVGPRDGKQRIDGAAMVQGRDMRPFAGPVCSTPGETPEPAVDQREGWNASAGTMAGNLGRVHMDSPEPRPKWERKLTPSQRNNYRKKQRRQAAKAARQGKRA